MVADVEVGVGVFCVAVVAEEGAFAVVGGEVFFGEIAVVDGEEVAALEAAGDVGLPVEGAEVDFGAVAFHEVHGEAGEGVGEAGGGGGARISWKGDGTDGEVIHGLHGLGGLGGEGGDGGNLRFEI